MLNSITDSMDMSLSKLWETVKDRGASYAAATEQEQQCATETVLLMIQGPCETIPSVSGD